MMRPAALVVFTDQHDIAWLRWLRPGFRHCFVVVRDPAGEWIACDWLKGRFAFRAYGPCAISELRRRFVARGHHVVVVDQQHRETEQSYLRLLTCVEVAKQALGLGKLRAVTPYGLFRALRAAGHDVHLGSEKIHIPVDARSHHGYS